MSRRFGNSAGEKYGVRVSWTFSHFSSEIQETRVILIVYKIVWVSTIRSKVWITIKVIILFVGIIGFVFECINAFEYLRGTRLYISDPGKGIATALFILCIMRCKFLITLLMRRKILQFYKVPSMRINLIFVFSTFDLVELGYLAQEGFQISWTILKISFVLKKSKRRFNF